MRELWGPKGPTPGPLIPKEKTQFRDSVALHLIFLTLTKQSLLRYFMYLFPIIVATYYLKLS